MAMTDLPIFGMLKTRMRWHQERQGVLAQNVANAETPGYRGKDLRFPTMRELRGLETGNLAMVRTDNAHLMRAGGGDASFRSKQSGFVTTPDGNAVNLEDEMLKVSTNQTDFQAAAGLYQRSLGLMRTAIGRRSG